MGNVNLLVQLLRVNWDCTVETFLSQLTSYLTNQATECTRCKHVLKKLVEHLLLIGIPLLTVHSSGNCPAPGTLYIGCCKHSTFFCSWPFTFLSTWSVVCYKCSRNSHLPYLNLQFLNNLICSLEFEENEYGRLAFAFSSKLSLFLSCQL